MPCPLSSEMSYFSSRRAFDSRGIATHMTAKFLARRSPFPPCSPAVAAGIFQHWQNWTATENGMPGPYFRTSAIRSRLSGTASSHSKETATGIILLWTWILDPSRSGAVVYLCHEPDESNGYVLGKDFIDFIDRWSRLGCPGPHDWAWRPFTAGREGLIDPDCQNAKIWREWLGLSIDT